jgi:hypothetical protein
MYAEHPVHDGDVAPIQLEDDDLAHANRRLGHVQEQKVTTLERRLHASAVRGHECKKGNSSPRVGGPRT